MPETRSQCIGDRRWRVDYWNDEDDEMTSEFFADWGTAFDWAEANNGLLVGLADLGPGGLAC